MLPSFWIGDFQVFTYPLMLGIIWGLSYHLSKKLISDKKIAIPHFNVFFIAVFVLAWLGAKVLFLITLEEIQAAKAMSSSNFWLGGGFVFYGGLLGAAPFVIFYKKNFKLNWHDMEFTIPVLVLGHAVGRLACFLAGCCYGSSCDLPWAIDLHGELRHPVQLYELEGLLLIFYVLIKRFFLNKTILLEYFVLYSILRFFLEFFRGDKLRGIYFFGISTSQLISLGIILVCAAILTSKKFKTNE